MDFWVSVAGGPGSGGQKCNVTLCDCRGKKGRELACGGSSCSYQHSACNCNPMRRLLQQITAVALILTQELPTADDSASSSNSGEDNEVQIVWATEARGIWGVGHVFEGKLYFTKDMVDDSSVPTIKKPKPIPKPAAKPAPKPAPKGRHVQSFQLRRNVGKGFYSTAPGAPDGQ